MTDASRKDIDQIAINTIRFLSVDMVEAAGCGHPGAPMGQAALAYRLFTRYLRHDPSDPQWPNRDRFVLSCGHASALIYSLLHLSGYDLPLDELRNFRQLHSKTAGHPEYGHTPGVETTTGPLGQGVGNAVGMAVAERMLAARFNRPDFELFDHRVWVLASDGDLMEGVASEASSWAGHLKLGKLTVIYDDNEISIDGSTDLTFTENVPQRYESYGWHVVEVDDGNDLASLDQAFEAAIAESERPTLIRVRTHIGYGSPQKQDTAAVHGAALGDDETAATKRNLGWPVEPTFHIPDEATQAFSACREQGAEAHAAWNARLQGYEAAHPETAAELDRRRRGELPEAWQQKLPTFAPEDGPLATRKASGAALTALAEAFPELVGGSADLAGSNNTFVKGRPVFSAETPEGSNFHFGVREHAMGAAMNGMALSGLLRPYGGTFLIFSDYMRPSIRLAALMGLPTVYVLTHDSVLLGEDGPTHQPVSQLLSMRSIPGLTVFRPADANETAIAWRETVANAAGPTALVLTRQKVPILAETAERASRGVARGAYVVADPPHGEPEAILIATGSEVALALDAHRLLAEKGIPTRVVSMPCWSRFDEQDEAYRNRVLPPRVSRRLAVEAGSPIGWHKYVGAEGGVHAQEGFGASAPLADLKTEFGYTPEAVAASLEKLLSTD